MIIKFVFKHFVCLLFSTLFLQFYSNHKCKVSECFKLASTVVKKLKIFATNSSKIYLSSIFSIGNASIYFSCKCSFTKLYCTKFYVTSNTFQKSFNCSQSITGSDESLTNFMWSLESFREKLCRVLIYFPSCLLNNFVSDLFTAYALNHTQYKA